MAYIGEWGTFIHIPKCAGISMRQYLDNEYGPGKEEGNKHDLPKRIDKAFAIVRHPVYWLLSFYTYMRNNGWEWVILPDYIHGQFEFAYRNGWKDFMSAITSRNPGAVGKVFDYYCVPGVKAYRLCDLPNYFLGIAKTHETIGKPIMSPEQREAICKAEADTMKRYGYT